jgi:hypothetical protein
VVEFNQEDFSNSWHPLQIIDESGKVIQTATGSSQRPRNVVFAARQIHAGKTFRFKDSLHGASLGVGLSLRVVAQGITSPSGRATTNTKVYILDELNGELIEIVGLSGNIVNATICTPSIKPDLAANNLCMSADVTVSFTGTEAHFQSTACTQGFLQQYKMTSVAPSIVERHSTTSITIQNGGPIGMAVDGTFIYGYNSSQNVSVDCTKKVDAHGRLYYDAIPMCLLKKLGGTVPDDKAWVKAENQHPQNLHEWVRVWPAKGDPSPLLGYALDGLPIYGPYGEDGVLMGWGGHFPSTDHPWYDVDSELDSCNGRTRKDGSYAYYMTPSPPYTIGCLRQKQGKTTSLNLGISCSNRTSGGNGDQNTTGTNASSSPDVPGPSGKDSAKPYVAPPHTVPSPEALAASIRAAPADIKPLIDAGVNASSEYCSDYVGTASLCVCLKVSTANNQYCAGFCSTSYSGYYGTVSDGYDGAVEITGWSCFYASRKYVAPTLYSYECLAERSQVQTLLVDVLYKYTFNGRTSYNDSFCYTAGLGVTYLENIPESHPIAILNSGKEHLISYAGDMHKGAVQVVDGVKYTFFHGDVSITVHGNFQTVSYYSTNGGYLGGKNMLKYSDGCLKYECLNPVSKVTVKNMNGKKFIFNGGDKYLMNRRYRIGTGTVVFTGISAYHAIAFLNADKGDAFQYHGNDAGLYKVVNGDLYKFYYGNVTITVSSDFGTIEFYCFNDEMGSIGTVEFSGSCTNQGNKAGAAGGESSSKGHLTNSADQNKAVAKVVCPADGGYVGEEFYKLVTPKPVAVPLRGAVACVDKNALTLRPTAVVNGHAVAASSIFGSFEAGFDASLPETICLGNATVPGGIDTHLAQNVIKNTGSCRDEDISLFGYCGGHAIPFHYHESMTCLYKNDPESGHSTRIGTALDGHGIYGKFIGGGVLPNDLDGCNGRLGVTPDSNGKRVYYYVVTENPPFTLGCFGKPDASTTHAECRHLYPSCALSNKIDVTTSYGTDIYVPDCPCYNSFGSNALLNRRPKFMKPAYMA